MLNRMTVIFWCERVKNVCGNSVYNNKGLKFTLNIVLENRRSYIELAFSLPSWIPLHFEKKTVSTQSTQDFHNRLTYSPLLKIQVILYL